MSKLNKLIEDLCPNGVEYKTVGEMCEVITGGEAPVESIKSKIPCKDYIYPIYSNGIGENSIWGYSKKYRIDKKAVTFSSIGTIGCPTIRNQYFTPIIRLKVIYPKNEQELNLSFLKYLLEIVKFEKQKSSVPNINSSMIKNIVIPVPPMKVQQEIVKILDKFSKIEAELEAELEARKRQYCYYREKLFEFNNDVELKTMGELFPFIRNGFVGTIRPFFTDEKNGIRYLEGTNIHNGIISDNEMIYVTKEFHQRQKKNELKEDDILMVQSGHIGECAVVGKKYKGANCHALIIMSNGGKCLSKYIVHYFHTLKGFKALNPAITGGTIKHVLAGKIGKIKVPCPPIEEQTKIVNILDKLEKLCNDISEGLPAEIEARQKQYEYYRDKLLTFKELKVNE